jgi:hypothetical protein
MAGVKQCSRPTLYWNRSSAWYALLILKRNAFRHLLTLLRNHLQHTNLIHKLTYARVSVCLCAYERVLFNDAVFCSDYVASVADEWNPTEHWWIDKWQGKRKMSMENSCQRPVAYVGCQNMKQNNILAENWAAVVFSIYLLAYFLHRAESLRS